jgi:hypothetical protein
MSRSISFTLARAFCVAGILLLLQACSGKSASNNDARVEKPLPVATPQPSPTASATPAAKLPPPTQAEVEAALHRVFGDDLVAQPNDGNGHAAFIVGDFNGDESEDLALIARPAVGKLDDINSELANWILQDADKAFVIPQGKTAVAPPKQDHPRVERGEQVLAIIHGFGPMGWRNRDARQAYIVKHGAAIFVGIARSISQKSIRTMHLPYETDIIKEVRNNKKGFVFWTGGVYAWHPSEG